ncbi:MAG: cupin domain-containing protein [Bdellovibrionales bacterium]|nr:cupin domain-containing protein [Bdellovibrionales bacterium]
MEDVARVKISELQLAPHPEGGYYREYYRSEELMKTDSLPDRYQSDRNFGTAIYFLLKAGEVSRFHSIRSDELWFFHGGAPIQIHILEQGRDYRTLTLGMSSELAAVIPRFCHFAAESLGDSYSLVSCVVLPGFDFEDFELSARAQLLQDFPEQESLIRRFTSS